MSAVGVTAMVANESPAAKLAVSGTVHPSGTLTFSTGTLRVPEVVWRLSTTSKVVAVFAITGLEYVRNVTLFSPAGSPTL